jgi:hypothetical protein
MLIKEWGWGFVKEGGVCGMKARESQGAGYRCRCWCDVVKWQGRTEKSPESTLADQVMIMLLQSCAHRHLLLIGVYLRTG